MGRTMADFQQRIPTNGWQSWICAAIALAQPPVMVVLLVDSGGDPGVWFLAVFTCTISGLSLIVIVRGWIHPDATECKVIDGRVYWHTPWPNRRSVEIPVKDITRLIIDLDEQTSTVQIELESGRQMNVPDECLNGRWREFVQTIRDLVPGVRVRQSGMPIQPV